MSEIPFLDWATGGDAVDFMEDLQSAFAIAEADCVVSNNPSPDNTNWRAALRELVEKTDAFFNNNIGTGKLAPMEAALERARTLLAGDKT